MQRTPSIFTEFDISDGTILDEELDNLGDDSSDDNVDEEASAQLDLARAYIDMGEEDEAKEILQQLIDGEDESLSADAKALLSRISS